MFGLLWDLVVVVVVWCVGVGVCIDLLFGGLGVFGDELFCVCFEVVVLFDGICCYDGLMMNGM